MEFMAQQRYLGLQGSDALVALVHLSHKLSHADGLTKAVVEDGFVALKDLCCCGSQRRCLVHQYKNIYALHNQTATSSET